MSRRPRTTLFVLAPVALVVLLLIVLIPGSSSTRKLPGCNNPDQSALNQYCDPVPASTGARAPHVGEAALGLVLPPHLVRRIHHARGPQARARRALLTLPAPAEQHPVNTAAQTQTASVASLSAPMIAVLALLALALGGAAAALGRRPALAGRHRHHPHQAGRRGHRRHHRH